jgi:putative transcriptional regulator
VRTRDIDPVTSGSRALLSLEPQSGFFATVPVARALIRRGVKPSVAKSVVERLSTGEPAAVRLQHYDAAVLDQELSEAHVGVQRQDFDVAELAAALSKARKKMKMSQDQFANAVGLSVSTLRNWEQARSPLDEPTKLLVRMVAFAPELAVQVAAASHLAQAGVGRTVAKKSAKRPPNRLVAKAS